MPKVVIVGAGLAGLSAAHELARLGYKIEIVEASSRAGGRIQTLREPFADGMYAEAGPISVPDNHFHVLRYMQEFDLPLDAVAPTTGSELLSIDRCRVVLNGTQRYWCLPLTLEERKLGMAGIQKKYLDVPAQAIDDPTQPGWPPEALRNLDDISAVDFFRQQGASEGAIQLLHLGLLDLYGEGLESCSALFLLACEHLLMGSNQAFKVYGGIDLLPQKIALVFQDLIHYGCVVTRIQQSESCVTAHFSRSGQLQSITGDYLVCAIPFPVLRTIEVAPPFSPDKQELIEELQNTSVSRVYVQTRSRFWQREKLSGVAETDLPVMLLFPAYTRPAQRGILESYTSGKNARLLNRMSAEERATFVVREMAKVFPGITSEVEAVTFKCWDLEPYEKGAYAFFRPGQLLRFLPQLGTPEGRVFFAGDQTTLLPGWMEGAVQSGIRAALQVQAANGDDPGPFPIPPTRHARAVGSLF